MTEASAAPTPATPFWKNPFAIALAVGIVTITVLPFLQRTTLRAPPPLGQMAEGWALRSVHGASSVAADDLRGKVWIAQLCAAPCRLLEVSMGSLVRHTEDVADKVKLVTVVVPAQLDTREPPPQSSSPQWHVVTGSRAEVDRFAQPMVDSFGRQPRESKLGSVAALVEANRFVLVDQQGAIRGFWKGDELGKGNVINAARMLARYGPNP